MDFETNWLQAASENSYSVPATQTELNALLCDELGIAKKKYIPKNADYTNLDDTGTEYKTAFGVATSGVMLFSALSNKNVDPFYPAVYGDVIVPDEDVEPVDWCLAHPQTAGLFHYHSASTCVVDAANYENRSGRMSDDLKTVTE